MRMKDKSGIVTAAASGMGRAGALLLAREGAKVCVVDRDAAGAQAVADEITAQGGVAFAIGADLRDIDVAAGLVPQAVARFGGLDFLWNHLGTPGPAAVEGLDWADFDLAVDLNLRSQLATTIAALPELRKRPGGNVLFTASTSGLSASTFSPIYSGVKAGVIGLVRGLAKRYAPEGIRVNAVCPGPVDTPMAREFVARKDQHVPQGTDREALVRRFGATTAMGRAGRPEEIGYAALFLLSDEASFITGAVLPVDGGLLA